MQVRHAIAAVSVAALAFALAACSSDPGPTTTIGEPTEPANTTSATPSAPATPEPTAEASGTPAPTGDVTIRPEQPGYSLTGVANSLRTGFESFADKSDDEIAVILNAGCDEIAATGTPEAAADKIQEFDIAVYDAAFSVSAAIVLYCPEYTSFLNPQS